MTLAVRTLARSAFVLLVSALLAAGCQKQQNNTQAPHQNMAAARENVAGGGRQRLRAICAGDIQKYCADADRLRRCLKENLDKLSDPCKAAVARRGGRKARETGGNDE